MKRIAIVILLLLTGCGGWRAGGQIMIEYGSAVSDSQSMAINNGESKDAQNTNRPIAAAY